MLLGMMVWERRPSQTSSLLMMAHGFVMSATRITGLPLVLYPLLRWCTNKQLRRSFVDAGLMSLIMAMGGVLFFIFCARAFGNWHLYMDTQYIGWNIVPDYTRIVRLSTYQLPSLWPHLPSFGDVGLLSIPLSTLWFVVLMFLEGTMARTRDAGGWRERMGLYVCAFFLFFLAIAGSGSVGMMSIIRHMFGVHLMLTLATAHMLAHLHLRPAVVHTVLGAFLLLSFLLLKLHSVFAETFMQGLWVA